MTAAEREEFEREGFLILPDALDIHVHHSHLDVHPEVVGARAPHWH
jgi:hypothetical protein